MFQTNAFTLFQQQKVIPNLDGLRGVSIFLVMIHHLPPLSTPLWHHLQVNGRLGVMLFFVISGFLITHLALTEKRSKGSFDVKDFYIRRSLRIFPLYYAVLAVVCFLVYAVNIYPPLIKAEFSAKLYSYLFYYSNLTGPIQGPFSLLWSLAVEEQFYLFFALIFYFLPIKWSRQFFFALTVGRLMMPIWGPFLQQDHMILLIWRYQEAILLGVSLAYLCESESFYNRFFWYLGNKYAWWGIFGLLTVCLCSFSVDESPWMETTVNLLFTLLVGISAMIVPLFLIGGPVLSHIGKISYGIYLFHTLIFYAVKRYISVESWTVFWVGAPLTILLAIVSYRYFEMYFLKMKKRFNPS